MYKMFTTSLALAAFASLALAQDTVVTVTEVLTISNAPVTSLASYTTALASIGSPKQQHVIKVGQVGFRFDPQEIQADVGDTLVFTFFAKNHSVTQSSFNEPCRKLVDSTGQQGVDSDFRPLSVASTVLTYLFTVVDKDPKWFYCKQTSHCPSGMVFALNPTPDKTFLAFQAKANASGTTSASPSGASAGASGGASGGSGSPTGTIPGTGAGTGTATGDNGATTSTRSGAISTSVNVGLLGVLGVVGVFVLAL